MPLPWTLIKLLKLGAGGLSNLLGAAVHTTKYLVTPYSPSLFANFTPCSHGSTGKLLAQSSVPAVSGTASLTASANTSAQAPQAAAFAPTAAPPLPAPAPVNACPLSKPRSAAPRSVREKAAEGGLDTMTEMNTSSIRSK
jgi:hypothetical protein